MIKIDNKGNFNATYLYLQKLTFLKKLKLDAICQNTVNKLKDATPKDTGLTANSWSYDIDLHNGLLRVTFSNSNIQNGIPIAVLLQNGHATRDGRWIEGIDYIDPVVRPAIIEIFNMAWEEVTNL